MGSFTDDADFVLLLSGSTNNNFSRRTLAVKSIANICTQLGAVHAARAVNAALLADSKEHLDITVRSILLQNQAQTF